METSLAGLFEKIWQSIESVVHPRQLVVVLLLVGVLLLFNPMNLVGYFNIASFVEQYRDWITIGFFLAFGLCAMWTIQAIWQAFRRWNKERSELLAVRRVALSFEAEIILDFVNSHDPDAVRLFSNNPFVRELRRNRLIHFSDKIFYSDQDAYTISQLGKSRLIFANLQPFYEKPEGDKLEFLRSVVGEELSIIPITRFG
ncbi:MAG: super-infection exclusion protein B [Sulfitobacter sp.]